MMGYFLLHQCALKKQRIVVLKSGWLGNAPHLFCQEGVFVLDNIAFQVVEELSRRDVLCVHISFGSLKVAGPVYLPAVIYWMG